MGQPIGQGHRNKPPEKVRVKWWCKRPPETAVMRLPGNPFREQGQAETKLQDARLNSAKLIVSGRPHRQMAIQVCKYRTEYGL